MQEDQHPVNSNSKKWIVKAYVWTNGTRSLVSFFVLCELGVKSLRECKEASESAENERADRKSYA